VRVETTGGGGWGDPLDREPARVVLDVVQGKVSARAAREEYGVVLAEGSGGAAGHDAAATLSLRQRLRETRGRLPFFDRGPGYRRLAGRDHADVDFVEQETRPRPECPRL
jgi:N-methylhydantoinase B